SVSVTVRDFFENHRVKTIMVPAAKRIKDSAGTDSFKLSIMSSVGAIPDAFQVKKLWYPAMGTPMKLTKSFPAKASAKPKVPAPITTTNTFRLKTEMKI